MDDSDSDYRESDGDYIMEEGMSRRTRNKGTKKAGRQKSSHNKDLKGANGGYAWEDEYHRSWDVVQEDAGGSLAGVVAGIVEESKKKRIIKDTTPVQRGIIRNVALILDLSSAMSDKDLRPNRYQVTLNYAIDFVSLFFDENPISQMGIIGMKDGLATLISEVDGNPNEHIAALQNLKSQEPKGDPSLQNALEMARGLLFHVASHCTKEVVVVLGALLSSDPGDIHGTIKGMVGDKIRAKVVGLSAQVAICKELVTQTNFGDGKNYGVALNDVHFKQLLMEAATPLAINTMTIDKASTLVEMGFPSRISETEPTMCACHSKLTQGDYLCPRCKSKICSLPMVCPCCGLTLILSTHLARSYHHLFPLKTFRQADDREAAYSTHCFACQDRFPQPGEAAYHTFHRYVCENCNNHFCIDCDVYCHDTLHNCPGCESRAFRPKPKLKNITLKVTGSAAASKPQHARQDEVSVQ